VVITGASDFEKDWQAYAQKKLTPFQERIDIAWFSGLPMEELLARTSELSRDTIIFYIGVFQDGAGRRYFAPDVARSIVEVARAPVYGVYSTYLDTGIVGGYMDTFEAVGRETARLGLRVLNGENPDRIAPYEAETHRYIVDWRQLQRWEFSARNLPANTEIRFKPPALWQQHKPEILTVLAILFLQSLLLIKFTFEVRRRRLAEKSLVASKEQMDLTAEAMNMGMWIWDAGTETVWTTENCRKLFGLTEAEALREQGFFNHIHPEDRERCKRIADEAVEFNRPFELECRTTREDGTTRWLHARGSPRCDAAGKVERILGIVTDITQRKHAELEAQEQRKQLTHLSRVSVLGALSGALAHELNQPLTAILSNTQAALRMLSRKTVDLKEIRQILQDILQDDKRAGDVIRHLRALLKKDDTQSQPLDANSVVSNALEISNSDLILKNVKVHANLAKHLPLINGDSIQLQQVVLNLIVNAVESMNGNTDERVLTLTSARGSNGYIRFSVTDTGHGIARADLEKLFEPFVTTKALGLGLGLPICRWIISAHGGQLWAESDPLGGAVFHVELPLHKEINA
jgi:PAS domain S-box-containing protein